MNREGLLAEYRKVAARIDKPGRHPVRSQSIDGAIDGKSLGDPAQIDPGLRAGKIDPPPRQQLDCVASRLQARSAVHPRQDADVLQNWGD